MPWLSFNLFVQGEDAKDRISASDRAAVKDNIVNIMLVSPEAIQKQLSDAIAIIGKYDFPAKWPNLINQMVEKFQTGKLVKFLMNQVSLLTCVSKQCNSSFYR